MLCRNKTKILSLYLVYPHYFRYNKRKAHTGEKYEFSGIFTGKGIWCLQIFWCTFIKEGCHIPGLCTQCSEGGAAGRFRGWELLEMKQKENPGVFEVTVQDAEAGMYYKYAITDAQGNVVYHCDPYGMLMELRPGLCIQDCRWKLEICRWWVD